MRKQKQTNKTVKAFVTENRVDPFVSIGSTMAATGNCWRWGTDNMFPYALAILARRSTAHRRIINDKADYISGKGFSFDENRPELEMIVEAANGTGETLRQVLNKLAFDKALFGNAFLEIVTNRKCSFVSFYHQDATKCRLSKDKSHIILCHNWREYTPMQAPTLPLYPQFDEAPDGTLRSIIHYKDYEPMFENYGVPPYIAGLNVSAIAYKTDKWNISRLDNSFQLSGVMTLDSDVNNEEEAKQIAEAAQNKFAGKPGQVLFLVKNSGGEDGSKFIPITSSNEGDWQALHEQSTTDIVVAHSWFRSLSGLDWTSGFNSDRILHEYEIALNTVILGEQAELMEPIREVLENMAGIDTSSLQIINRPPITQKPSYMMVWEARKADGLDYDENDPKQQVFLSNLKQSKNGTDNE